MQALNTTPEIITTDFNSLGKLRSSAQQDPNKALEIVAEQFESLYLSMMLKEMRQTNFGKGLFDSDAMENYQKMHDQQLTSSLSKSGALGIADLIVKQLSQKGPTQNNGQQGDLSSSLHQLQQTRVMNRSLSQEAGLFPAEQKANAIAKITELLPLSSKASVTNITPVNKIASKQQAFANPQEFVEGIWSHAEAAAKQLGVPTEALVSQAALETGWGKHVITDAKGNSSHNLFGIKADNRWSGEKVSVATTEYRSGVINKEQAHFRAYDSFEQSFKDFVNFLKSSPRYAEALNSNGDSNTFVSRLQQAGYATDPAYAKKIKTIMQSDTFNDARTNLGVKR